MRFSTIAAVVLVSSLVDARNLVSEERSLAENVIQERAFGRGKYSCFISQVQLQFV